jgi:hypothetical protein
VEIIIEPHTLQRANERGSTEDEIKITIEQGADLIGKKGRLGKSKVFDFNRTRNGTVYEEKKIEVYFIVESGMIITVTVYVFYGKFTL